MAMNRLFGAALDVYSMGRDAFGSGMSEDPLGRPEAKDSLDFFGITEQMTYEEPMGSFGEMVGDRLVPTQTPFDTGVRTGLEDTGFNLYDEVDYISPDLMKSMKRVNRIAQSVFSEMDRAERQAEKERLAYEKEQARQQAAWDKGWEIAGSDFTAQDMFHDMSIGAFNTDPMPMRDKYDPWSLG